LVEFEVAGRNISDKLKYVKFLVSLASQFCNNLVSKSFQRKFIERLIAASKAAVKKN
jgi:hypothetical protein